MLLRLLLVLAALAVAPWSLDAQMYPVNSVASYGMPDRDFAPGVLVFNADPNSWEQYQHVYFKEVANDVQFVPEESCRAWIKTPVDDRFEWHARGVGVVPRSAPGAYTCNVTVAQRGRSLGVLRVFLNVGAGATGGITPNIAAPNQLSLNVQTSTARPQTYRITVNADRYYATATRCWEGGASYGTAGMSTVMPASREVTLRTGNFMDVWPDRQCIYIETPGGSEVVRMRADLSTTPVVLVEPASVNVSYRAGQPSPTASFTVTSTSDGDVGVSVGSTASWLKIARPTTQTTPAVYGLSFDASQLPDGLHTAMLTISAPIARLGIATLPVVLQVTGNSTGAGSLTVSPASLAFSAVVTDPAPARQTVSVRGSATNYTAVPTTNPADGAWLQVLPQTNLNTTDHPTFSVAVNHAGLRPGSYSGTVAVTSAQSSRTIAVTLTVASANPVVPVLTVTPASVSFRFRQGDAAPAPVSVQVGGTAGRAFAATVSTGAAWLAVSPSTGTVSTTSAVTVAVSPAALPPGVHAGAIVIADPAGTAPSVTVPVSLEVVTAPPAISKVVNAASYSDVAIAAGEIVTIFGDRLGPVDGALLTMTGDGKVATSAGGVEVLVGGYLAPILYAGKGQVSAIIPYEITSPYLPFPSIVVRYGGQTSARYEASQASSAPGIFTADSSGKGRGAILNADFTPNTPERPAAPGDIVQLFVTGEGQTNPPGITGKVTTVSATGPLTPQPLGAIAVTIGGRPAKVHFYGEAPNLVAGLMQINVEIPAGTPSGDVPVVVVVGSEPEQRASQTGVTVSVR